MGDAAASTRLALLIPVLKAWATDRGVETASLGVQVHGGMGFIEDTGAAQVLRDARIAPIYEGTNGIQAMDLVGRKMMDGGEAALRLIDEIEAGAEAARSEWPDLATPVWNAAEALREGTELLLAQSQEDRNAGAVPYLTAFARVLGGHFHLKAAMAEAARADLARVYIRRLMPDQAAHLAQLREGAAGLYALTPQALQA
jgi:hypothetical protein